MYSFFVYCKKLLCVKKFKLLLVSLSLSPEEPPTDHCTRLARFFSYTVQPPRILPRPIYYRLNGSKIHHSAVLLLSPFSVTFSSLCSLSFFLCPPPPLSLAFVRSRIAMCVQVYTGTVCTLEVNESAVRLIPPMPRAEGPWRSFYGVNRRRTQLTNKKESIDTNLCTPLALADKTFSNVERELYTNRPGLSH